MFVMLPMKDNKRLRMLLQVDPQQCFSVIDGKVLCEIPLDDAPIFLLAAFYTFNICYPVGCHNLYCFLEVILLKLEEPHIVVTISVKNFLAIK